MQATGRLGWQEAVAVMQWLGLYFPDLPLEVFWSGEADAPLAVTRRRKGRDVIDRCNASARQWGVRPDMSLNAALVLVPGLHLHERDDRREQQRLEAIAAWAWSYSSHISFDPLLLLLEVGGSARLFGGIDVLLEKLRADARAPVVVEYHALAPSPGAAALLARLRPGSRVDKAEGLQAALGDLSLAHLTRDRKLLALMQGIGLSSIAEVLALPRPELARRAGQGPVLLLDRLLGRIPDPRPLWQPPEHFQQSLLLLAEVEQASALQFPARCLVDALCAFLYSRDAAVQQLHWRFLHRDAPPSELEQGMLAPTNQSGHILELFRQHLENLQLPEAVVEMELRVDTWQAADKAHGDLFARLRHEDQGFLERLRARLGEDAVRGLQGRADHRPEKAWSYREPLPVRGEHAARREGFPEGETAAPLWLLPRPRRLSLRNGHPWHEGRLQLHSFSRRIETGWWDGEDVARDYYRARNPAGQELWVYRDRRSGQWFLQGLFE
jgi:protein ImuB